MAKRQKLTRYESTRQRAKRHAKLAFVPHKANQYRPHLVRRWGLLSVLALVFFMQATYNFTTEGSVLGDSSDLTATQLITTTNETRAKAGLNLLAPSEELEDAARAKALDMFDRQYWAHNAPDGTEPWVFLDRAGYSYAAAGENLARNFSSSQATVAAWMASPEHRANLLEEDYEDIGLAVAYGQMEGRQTTIVVAMYGEPSATSLGARVVSPASTVASASSLSPVTRLGVALQGLSPAVVGSLILMLVAALVALVAHAYRDKLPKGLRRSWYRHHGLIKSGGLASLAVVMVIIYGGGSL